MAESVSGPSTASAPASSANLGPGFDTIALALDLRCVVTAEVSDQWETTHVGPEAFRGAGADDAVLRAAQRVSDQPLRIEVESAVPVSRGLGSSAAAFTAGTLATLRAIGEDPDHDELFALVRELEGHPDNAAAAVYGGLVAVADGEVIHLSLSPDLIPIVAVPGAELKTSDARAVLPEAYRMDVVARSLGRLTALVEGLRTGSKAHLSLAAGDELHEGQRAALNPVVAQLMASALASGAFHACWSGAGPSILALTQQDSLDGVVAGLERDLGPEGASPDPGSGRAWGTLIAVTPITAWFPSPLLAPTTYPGKIPGSSYVIAGGKVHTVPDRDVLQRAASLGVDLRGRIAVLACGSNAAPARLVDKCGVDADIPVMRVTVDDTAIVYSAHISRYGSIPATRIEHRGSKSTVHVPLLDPDQLVRIDETEGSYERIEIEGSIDGIDGPVFAYRSWRGLLERNGELLRVDEVPATSSLPAATQLEALDLVADMTGLAASGEELSKRVMDGAVDL